MLAVQRPRRRQKNRWKLLRLTERIADAWEVSNQLPKGLLPAIRSLSRPAALGERIIHRVMKEDPSWRPLLFGGSGEYPKWFTGELIRLFRPAITRTIPPEERSGKLDPTAATEGHRSPSRKGYLCPVASARSADSRQNKMGYR